MQKYIYNYKYIHQFFRLTCMLDMWERKLFPNLKEVTESIGMYEATLINLDLDLKDTNTAIVVIGDGHTPRTAAMFAFRSALDCYSIDPNLREKNWNVKRLTVIKEKIENVKADFLEKYKRVVFILPHAHVNFKMMSHLIDKRASIVNMPCCTDFHCPFNPEVAYVNFKVHSPKNIIEVYKVMKEYAI